MVKVGGGGERSSNRMIKKGKEMLATIIVRAVANVGSSGGSSGIALLAAEGIIT